MNEETLDLADFILEHDLQAEIVSPGAHMPTVDAAAAAMKVSPEQIFKSILFQAKDGRCVMVVACGNGRVDLHRVPYDYDKAARRITDSGMPDGEARAQLTRTGRRAW